MITCLTSEQENLIQVIKDKWKKIALNNSPTDKNKAEAAIIKLYQSADLRPPQKIEWFDNLIDACLWLGEKSETLNFDPIEWMCPCYADGLIERDLHGSIKHRLGNNYYEYFAGIIYSILKSISENYLLDRELFYFQHILGYTPIDYYDNARVADYYDAINIKYHGVNRNWAEIAEQLGFSYWWALKDLVVATTKPSVIKLDDDLKLHSKGEVAFAYDQESSITDEKIKLYAYHGNILPEKYGLVHPINWQAKWLYQEKDIKLRWILARLIGYHKLSQEFFVSEIKTWNNNNLNLFHECTLLKVQNNPHGIFFIKIISFDQDKTYFCLLPEDIFLVRQAEIWIKNMIYSKPNLDYVIRQLIAT